MPDVCEPNNFNFPLRYFILRKLSSLSLTDVIFIAGVYSIF